MTAEEITEYFRRGDYCQCNILQQIPHGLFERDYWVYGRIVRLCTYPCGFAINGVVATIDTHIDLCIEFSSHPAHETPFSHLLIQYTGLNHIAELRHPITRLSL